MDINSPVIDFLCRLQWCIRKRFPLRLILCDVPFWSLPKTTIFPHPYGITIRGGTIIGEGCIINQNATIGQRRTENTFARIGNGVHICAGATILGSVVIGDRVIIAAGAMVLEDIDDDVVYVNANKKYLYGVRLNSIAAQ